jgi:hypothetical protein
MDKHTSLTKVTENKRKRTFTTRKTIFKVITKKYQEIQKPLIPDETKN